MGIMQVAVETYDSLQEQYAGKIIQDHATMAPVSHILTSAQIEITLDQNGGFVDAVLLDKNEPKIVIPVTEESAGRTSSPCAHPLCEQLGYLTGLNEEKYRLYIDQLTKWAESSHSHMLLLPVLNYVKSGKILSDLLEREVIRLDENGRPENEKMLVRWRMVLPDRTVESWKDSSLFQSFIEFYEENKRKGKQGICMLSGKQSSIALQHPKGIISINGNAKLISANDSSGFTYRGRFVNDEQALTISYDMSQKAHNALRWIAADQGVQVIYGGRTFLCWNPHGKEVRLPMAAFMLPSTLPSWKNATDYHNELKRILAGERAKFPETEKVIIAAFDAATTGRLALTYYNELEGSDYLQRLMEWDMHCCWYRGKFGIQPPLLIQIINNAFGVQRSEKNVPQMKADDRVVRQQMHAAGYTYTAAKVSKEAGTTHDGAFGGQASLNMLVYDFGRTRASTRRAINALVSAERDARTAENATRYAVRSACYALRRTEELRDVAAETADIYAQHKKQMQDRYDVGAVNSYAVTKAGVDWSQAVLEAVTASNSVLTARAGLNHALGLADAPDFAITDSGIRTYEGLGIEELIDIARTNAPALASLRAAAEGASDYVDYTVANLYPSLGISIQYQATYDDSTLLWNLVGAGQLSQSIFCAGRKRRAIDAAVAQLRIARAAVSAEELSLRNEITKAVLAAIRAQQQFDVAVETRKMAEENYRIVAQRYDVGKASELERSDAQVAVSSAKAAVVAAKYDYFDSQILISRLIGE